MTDKNGNGKGVYGIIIGILTVGLTAIGIIYTTVYSPLSQADSKLDCKIDATKSDVCSIMNANQKDIMAVLLNIQKDTSKTTGIVEVDSQRITRLEDAIINKKTDSVSR